MVSEKKILIERQTGRRKDAGQIIDLFLYRMEGQKTVICNKFKSDVQGN